MKLIGLLLIVFSINANSAVYLGGFVVDGNVRLMIADTETNKCVSVRPYGDFKWITSPGELSPLADFSEKYNISNDVNDDEVAFCQSYIQFKVEPNWWADTRPMRDENLTKRTERIAVGTPCENELVKPRRYHFATNKDGFRGLVVCQ